MSSARCVYRFAGDRQCRAFVTRKMYGPVPLDQTLCHGHQDWGAVYAAADALGYPSCGHCPLHCPPEGAS